MRSMCTASKRHIEVTEGVLTKQNKGVSRQESELNSLNWRFSGATIFLLQENCHADRHPAQN